MEDKVMKRLMVILASVCFAANIFASELIVKGNIDVPFSVFINGEKYYSYNNKVNVGYLPSGRYGMEIYTEGYSYELLYDHTIDIPRNATVYATFTGDNRMYISTSKNAPEIIIDLTPYPRRAYAPAPKPVYHAVPKHHVAPAPKPAPHKVAPKPAPAPHKVAPKPAPKPAPSAKPAPKNNNVAPAPKSNSSRPSSTVSKPNNTTRSTAPKASTARTTPNTRK